MKKIIALLILLTSQLGTAQATAVISQLSYTDKSITFTATGDLSGYPMPTGPLATDQFSIVYTGNILTQIAQQNSYAGNLLTGSSPFGGNSGGFTGIVPNYTWIYFGQNVLPAASFSGTAFTVQWIDPQLNPTGTGAIQFVWGNPSNNTTTLIQSFSVINGSVTAVPEPETYAMMLAGLGLLGFMVRRRNKQA